MRPADRKSDNRSPTAKPRPSSLDSLKPPPHDIGVAKTLYERTMDRALRLLSYKARTVKEMRERLLKKEWADEITVDQVLARLEELALLNDQQFATSFAHSRLTIKPIGRVRLRRDLQRKKLPSQAVENALDVAFDERNEEDLIQQAIEKRIRLKGPPKSREEAKKLFEFLLRRGFPYDLIRRKIHEIDRRIDIDEEAS